MTRHWYHSAQSTESSYLPPSKDHYTNGTIVEEESEDEKPSTTSSPAVESNNQTPKPVSNDSPVHTSALSELRFHELLALFACFIFPLVGAWLLHTIRSQLSRPSEGLVSNYNLTIFLLASELRPISHLIKLIQARTLYLQRSLHPSLNGESSPPASQILDLTSRLDNLEATLTNTNPSIPPLTTLTTDIRKSIQPDLDALNRAVRRYEKRATLLSMQTESRLQDLEARLCDALTLAAAAERSSSAAATTKPTHGSALILLDWICATIVLPIQAVWWTCAALPLKLAKTALTTTKSYFMHRNIQPQPKPTKPPPRSSTSGGGTVHYERKPITVPRRGGKKAM